MAADIAIPALAITRLLAVDGQLQILTHSDKGDGDEGIYSAADLRQLNIAHGIGNDNGLEVTGRIDYDRGTAPFTATVGRADNGFALTVRGEGLPLAPLRPLVPRGIDLRHGRGSGRFLFITGNPTKARIAADVEQIRVDDRRISAIAFPIGGYVFADVSARSGALDVQRISFRTGALELSARARLEYDGAGYWLPDRGDMAIELGSVPCGEGLASLPAGMRPRLRGLDLAGQIAGNIELQFDRTHTSKTALKVDIDEACRVIREARDVDPRQLDGNAWPPALWRPGHLASQPRRRSGDRLRRRMEYIALTELPTYLPKAFVAAEDARFWVHNGFDRHQIERSLAIDLRMGAFVRGGSTITQQLAKNLYLNRDRNLARKFQEAILTWRLEARLPKADILERYLNIIEFGPDVYGIAAAARFWFDKDARTLSVREAAFIASLTPAPMTLSRRISAAGGKADAIGDRVDGVLAIMRRERVISSQEYRHAMGERLELSRARSSSHAEK